ncbi:hypothetical protein M5689_019587 [Euphorbia peplus]|nr:hypothetical protein M5689_019587 [Euphorbia peplus]
MRQLYSNSENPITISPKPYSKTSESENKLPNKVSESKTKIGTLHKFKKNAVSESGRNTTDVCNDDGLLRSSIKRQVFEAWNMASNETHLHKSCDPIGVSLSVKSTLYNKWGLSNTINKQKYQSFLYSLKDPTNRDLRRKILMGEIKVGRITELKPEYIASKVRKNLNYRIQSALEKCVVGKST